MVMDATEAAELTAVLRPDVAIPYHCAYSSGWLGDGMIIRTDPDPGTSPRPPASWRPTRPYS
jgi:hypothetical protein